MRIEDEDVSDMSKETNASSKLEEGYPFTHFSLQISSFTVVDDDS